LADSKVLIHDIGGRGLIRTSYICFIIMFGACGRDAGMSNEKDILKKGDVWKAA